MIIINWLRIIGGTLVLLISGLVYYSPHSHHEAVQEIPTIVNIKNPIGFFCGSDCSNCKHDADTCLEILKANLKHLCSESDGQGCYSTWVEYAKTCQHLCSKPLPPLTSAAKMVNLVASDA